MVDGAYVGDVVGVDVVGLLVGDPGVGVGLFVGCVVGVFEG